MNQPEDATVQTGEGADDFDLAFDQAIAEPQAAPVAETAKEPAAAEPAASETTDANPAGDKPAAAAADTTVQPGDKPAGEGDTPAGAAPVTEQKPAEPAAHAAAEQQPVVVPPNLDPKFLAQAIAEATAAAAKQQPAEPAPAEVKPVEAKDFYSADDVALIDKFRSEWPDEHAAVTRMMDGVVQATVQNRVNELIGQLNTVLAPIVQAQQQTQAVSFESFVSSKHPDVSSIQNDVQAWIKEQPGLYQPALQNVYDKGNAQQVVELLDMFKQAKGQTGAAAAPPASSAAQEAVQPKSRPAPAAVAALAAVPAGQRSKPASGPDVNDFDAAFDQALAADLS